MVMTPEAEKQQEKPYLYRKNDENDFDLIMTPGTEEQQVEPDNVWCLNIISSDFVRLLIEDWILCYYNEFKLFWLILLRRRSMFRILQSVVWLT